MPGRPKFPGRVVDGVVDTRPCGKQLSEPHKKKHGWTCPGCQLNVYCKSCCNCDGEPGIGGKRLIGHAAPKWLSLPSASTSTSASASASSSAPASGSAAPAAPVARRRSRSRSFESRASENRRISRKAMELDFLAQWRLFKNLGDRPMPSPGRYDSGLVCYGTWKDRLQGEARVKTEEILSSTRWQEEGTHSSVHLTLYLRWAHGAAGGRA